MNEKALKIVNSLITSDLIQTVTEKTKLDQRTIVQIAIEISGKLIGDENNISKNQLEDNIKKLVQNDELKSFLESLESKHNIPKAEGSAILSELLPPIFRNFLKIDQSYFEDKEEIKPTVIKEEPKEEKQVEEEKTDVKNPDVDAEKEEKKQEPTVDNIFENIEKKAAEDISKKSVDIKKPFSLKLKKSENQKQITENNKVEIFEDDSNNKVVSILETICMIGVGIAFFALLIVVIILFLKQRGIV